MKTFVISLLAAMAMVGLQRAIGIPFWPAFAMYLFGQAVGHVLWVMKA